MAWHLKHYTNIFICCIVPTVISSSFGQVHAVSAVLKLVSHDPILMLQDNKIPWFFVISVKKWWAERKWVESSLQHHLPPSESLLKWGSWILPFQQPRKLTHLSCSLLYLQGECQNLLFLVAKGQSAEGNWLDQKPVNLHFWLIHCPRSPVSLLLPLTILEPTSLADYFSLFPPQAQIIAVKKNGFTSLSISLSAFFSGD